MQAHLRPPLFLMTGFGWLLLSAGLGVALWLGLILGWSLPHSLRLVHAHGALVGGVAQIILGAMLSFIPTLLMTGKDRAESHPVLFTMINAGAVALITGFWLKSPSLIAAAGSVVLLAFLNVLSEAIRQARQSLNPPPLNLLFYGLALTSLIGGISMGLGIVMGWLPVTMHGQGRLAHIHLNVLGFITLTIVGTMHNLFPTVLNAPLSSPALARLTFVVMPVGILGLVTGFLTSRLWMEIGSGMLLLGGAGAYAFNMVRTWVGAGRPRTTPVDHFLLATVFLVLAIVTGTGVAVNALWDPPALPFGQLHLVAYTHLALIGFIFQTIIGALSHLLPIIVTLARVASNKKRAPYLATLNAIVERWRPLQIGMLSLGTIGLLLVGGLVWQFSLNSTPVLIAAWASATLLTLGLLLVATKFVRLLLCQPSLEPAAHRSE
jgi:hypothetical protein